MDYEAIGKQIGLTGGTLKDFTAYVSNIDGISEQEVITWAYRFLKGTATWHKGGDSIEE